MEPEAYINLLLGIGEEEEKSSSIPRTLVHFFLPSTEDFSD